MNKKTAIFLILILILGTIYRGFNIREKGIFFVDEAIYLQHAQFATSAIYKAFNIFLSKFKEITGSGEFRLKKEIKRAKEGLSGIPFHHAKPTHSALITFFSLLTLGVKDYSGHLMNAFLGIFTIYLTFILAKKMYNTTIALYSALILAISGYHILYSRESLGEIDALFFFTLSIYFYYLSRVKEEKNYLYLGLSGILAGISFTCNYRWFLVPIFLWLYELHLFFTKKPYISKDKLKRFLLLNICMLFPLVLWEIPYYMGMMLFKRAKDVLPFQTYLEQLIFQIFMYKGLTKLSIIWNNIFTYPYLFFRLNGFLINIILLIGIWKTLKKGTLANFILLSQILIPLFLFSLYSIVQQNCRFMSITFLAVAIITSKGLYELINEDIKISSQRKITLNILVVIFLILSTLPINIKILRLKSGYKEAIEYLKSVDGEKHITTNYYLSTFYIPHNKVKHLLPKTTLSELKEYYHEGYRYLISDIQRFYYITDRHTPAIWPDKEPKVLSEVKKILSPVHTIIESRGRHLQFWFDHNRFFRKTLKFYQELSLEDKSRINIYDLKNLFGA